MKDLEDFYRTLYKSCESRDRDRCFQDFLIGDDILKLGGDEKNLWEGQCQTTSALMLCLDSQMKDLTPGTTA